VGKPNGNRYSLGDPMHGGGMMLKCVFGLRVGTYGGLL